MFSRRFVYDNINLESGNQMVSAGLNNLFGEVMWFYPTTGSSVVNRMVTYNYFDSSPQRPVWTVGTLARTMWEDSAVFGNPHATEYDAGMIHLLMLWVTQKVEQYTINMKQEQIKFKVVQQLQLLQTYQSGDFDITQRIVGNQQTGIADTRGDGEFIMKIRRFIPDFISQTGATQSYIKFT